MQISTLKLGFRRAVRTTAAAMFLGATASAQMMLMATGLTEATLPPGAQASFGIMAMNMNSLPDTITVWSSEGTLSGDPTGYTMSGGEVIYFGLDVPISTTATPGTIGMPVVSASTSLGSFASVGFTVRVDLPPAGISFAQPGGPGSPAELSAIGAYAGFEYFNVFSVELPPGGYGTGPYLGLYASNFATLLDQLNLPPGTPPFRFTGVSADGSLPTDLGTYGLPVGLTFDVLTLYPRLFPGPTDPPFYWTAVNRFTIL